MPGVDVQVEWYDGPRAAVRPLFELAEDSASQLDGYLEHGRVLVARHGGDVVGHLQLVDAGEAGEVELKNMAVREAARRSGVGSALVASALDACRAEGVTRLVVGTAAADIDNLRFYQRCGFRFLAVERDAFTPATGYPEPVDVDGIPLRDRVWLAYDLR
jgi:GNAT superfamily N-acetyltransferase